MDSWIFLIVVDCDFFDDSSRLTWERKHARMCCVTVLTAVKGRTSEDLQLLGTIRSARSFAMYVLEIVTQIMNIASSACLGCSGGDGCM